MSEKKLTKILQKMFWVEFRVSDVGSLLTGQIINIQKQDILQVCREILLARGPRAKIKCPSATELLIYFLLEKEEIYFWF